MKNGFENIACPVCNSDNQAEYLKTYDRFDNSRQKLFTIVKCQNCNFVFVNPRPNSQNLGKFYEVKGYDPFLSTEQKFSIRDKFYMFLRNFNLSQKYSKISKLKPEPGKILDIGCATGEFLQKFREPNWQCTGVEVVEDARNKAKSKNIAVYPSVDTLPQDSKFDIITMWHVLEHVHNLQDSVKKIESLLKKDGFLIIAVPNIDSFDAGKYGKNWIALDTPRHLYHFSTTTISKLMEHHNLQLIKKHSIILDILYNNLMSKNLSQTGFLKFSIILLKSLIRSYLGSKNNSSTLVYYFQKEK